MLVLFFCKKNIIFLRQVERIKLLICCFFYASGNVEIFCFKLKDQQLYNVHFSKLKMYFPYLSSSTSNVHLFFIRYQHLFSIFIYIQCYFYYYAIHTEEFLEN